VTGGPLNLHGKTALVTGAASGIGAAVARALASRGAHVVVADRDQLGGESIVREIANAGGRATFAALDVTAPVSVDAAFAASDVIGTLDLLVCSAGIGFIGDILATGPEDFDRLMSVNARGVFLCCQAAVKRMKATGRGGAIVNIASIAGKIALSERFAYAATKGAVLMMTRAIACDFVKDQIRCNCVCPARVHTAFVDAYLAKNYPGREAEKLAELADAQPMGRMGEPDEIANLVLYLCSDEAAFITGAAYDIDGGCMAMR
jgi:2-keto-3-deoxy-L-fuconate dehydrogenase